MINAKSISDVSVNNLLISEKIAKNTKLIADNFNTFSSVAAKINEKIIKAKNLFSHYLGQTTNENIFSHNSSNKSPINCIKPLGDMINLSFNKGIFSDFLKVLNVISVHKKRRKMVLSMVSL